MIHSRMRVLYTGVGLFLSLITLAGCNGSKQGDASGGSQGGEALVSAGKAAYESNGCSNCHALGGQGGKKAPDLTKAGAEHNADWIAEHVKNPKTHNPNSRMPSYEGKIDDKTLKAIGSFLASQK